MNCPVNAANPTQKDSLSKTSHPERNYWSEAHTQINKIIQTSSLKKYPNQVENISSNQQENKNPPIVQNIQNKLASFSKRLIFDPEHPGQFFDYLIKSYSFLTNLEKQLIPYGEKLLGNKNQLVIRAKENYTEQIKYLEALKQQKLLIEQNKNK
jgi:hypothetical protein